MTDFSADLWRDHLLRARWFQGKGLAVDSVRLRAGAWYVATGEAWVRSEFAEVDVGGTLQTYHLLVGYLAPGSGETDALVGQTELTGRGLVDVVDAPRSPTAMAAFLAALAGAGESSVSWLETPPDPTWPTTVFAGEQSNTNVRIGDAVVLKLFRKLSPGPNLETQALMALGSSGITPRLIGTLSTPDQAYDLGIFCQFIADSTDGFDFAVTACREDRPIMAEMEALGSTLRNLHLNLSLAFGPDVADASDIGAAMVERLDRACDQVTELADVEAGLRQVLDLEPGPVAVQRLHGDFHLGQTLVSPAGWTVIDFEGEPLKTPAERIAPDAVWRDVAGLLRSLDYACSATDGQVALKVRRWRDQARAAFLRGYLDGASLPEPLLRAYEIDKAIYEFLYELRNRPTWVDIPRRAIHEAIAAIQG